MIVFDLACAPAAHVFEIWFGSSADYESQNQRGLISCPYCGSIDVDKAVMAPRVAAKGNQRSEPNKLPVPASDGAVPMASGTPSPEQFKAMVHALAEVQAKMLKGSEHVGRRFADEARSMHLGEIDSRPIHGQATIEEAQALVEEGIPVAALPLPVRPPGQDN
ncbi:MAG: hypothetical protein JWR77_643 [Rhizorhabdus sp.]|nr:hypothetical protein [Rhizorhabdus sp.]